MKHSFFDSRAGSDTTYEALRAPDHRNAVHAREHFDALWSVASPFLDADIRSNARIQCQQAFWEVYLAAALVHLGSSLVPRRERRPRSGGPDLLQRDPSIFFEAVAVTPGTAADAVSEAVPGVVRDVPDVGISLRLTSGLFEKLKQYQRHLETRAVPSDAPYVIAINGGAVPSARAESTLPRIVRTVFPFGHETLHFDSSTWRCVGRSFRFRPVLTKQSGAIISTSFFEEPDTQGISAVLYSSVNPFNRPATIGEDFVLVHNPQASNPLPRGSVPGAWEFWIQEEHLRGEKAG